MKNKSVNSQLYNYKTYLNYQSKMLNLALNVFQFKNLDPFIETSKLNYSLLFNGSVAFFKDDVTGKLLAMPYTSVGSLDYYGRPQAIRPLPYFGAYNRTLYKKRGEFVIMYDNEAHIPIYPRITASAERMALIKRTIDINIEEQQTSRYWKTSEEKKLSLQKALEQIDSKNHAIVTYDGLDLNDMTGILLPAPYVAGLLNEAKKEEWSEFLEDIGITSNTVQKKERVITDEIFTSMGGTIASRYNRFESRKKAIKEINELFGTNIEVAFYDGLPATIKNPNEFLGISEEGLNNANDESEL